MPDKCSYFVVYWCLVNSEQKSTYDVVHIACHTLCIGRRCCFSIITQESVYNTNLSTSVRNLAPDTEQDYQLGVSDNTKRLTQNLS